MNNKDFKARVQEIRSKKSAGKVTEAYDLASQLIQDLSTEKDNRHISELYHHPSIGGTKDLYCFELAYALAETGPASAAEHVYEYLLASDPHNSAVLNNLSNIKKAKGDLDGAWGLIQRAFAIAVDDPIISRNYQNLKTVIDEQHKTDAEFQSAVKALANENEFVVTKLSTFLRNVQKDDDFRNGALPIAGWKFRALMNTDAQKSEWLKRQWLDKNYLRKTGGRGQYNEPIYQINPYLEKALQKLTITRLPDNWMSGINQLDTSRLSSMQYYETVEIISRVRAKFRNMLIRDVNELFLNHIMQNTKAVVTLAGSIVETVLIYYCEKKRILQITYTQGGKQSTKKLYDADLGDLLSYFEQEHLLSDLLVHMGNISRISRNFIHPGKELRGDEELSQSKADICFMSALEIIKSTCG